MERKKWSDEEIIFLKENYENKGVEYCSNMLNRKYNTIQHKANRLSLKVNKDVVSNTKRIKVKESWENGRLDELRKENLSKKLKTDLFNINENFAYVLGYLWGDGYLIFTDKRYNISLTIEKEDGEEIKDKMMSILEWNISYRNRTKRKEQMVYSIGGKLISEFFSKYDFLKKSYVSPDKILELIPENNKKYFYMGLSDADGCFYLNKKHYTYQYFVASTYEQDWNHMKTIFDELDIKYKICKREHNNKDGNYSKSSIIRITNKKDVIKFGDYLYSTDFIGLNRKLKKYLEIKNEQR